MPRRCTSGSGSVLPVPPGLLDRNRASLWRSFSAQAAPVAIPLGDERLGAVPLVWIGPVLGRYRTCWSGWVGTLVGGGERVSS